MRGTDGGQFFISCSCYVILSYCHCHFIVYSNIKHETCIPFHTSELHSFLTDLNLSAVSLQITMINISPAECHPYYQPPTTRWSHWHCRLKYFFSFFLCLGFNWHNRATQLPPPSLSFLLITMHCSQLNARRNYRNTMRTIFCNKKCYKKMLFSCNLKQKIFLCLLHCK